VFWPILTVVPHVWRVMRLVLGPRAAAALYIPTSAARNLTFKFMLEFARLPALGDLLRAFMRAALNGDRSQWDRAVQLPHYNARSMPAVSLHQGLHFVQLWRSGRFRLFDYGSRPANLARYGQPAPPDIAAEYWRLDVPVDICAGSHDGVIPPANVRRHVDAMRGAGVDVTYREFEFGVGLFGGVGFGAWGLVGGLGVGPPGGLGGWVGGRGGVGWRPAAPTSLAPGRVAGSPCACPLDAENLALHPFISQPCPLPPAPPHPHHATPQHLDFTLRTGDELRYFVLARLAKGG
jgi:hypothetical protein